MKVRALLQGTVLVALGCLQMAGDVLGLPRLKALGATLQVAPAMKVFTAHQGYETHAARFSITWLEAGGQQRRLLITPRSYAGVRGPYNRRNVYGAALAYGPLLRIDPATRSLQESVMRYAFCSPATMRTELGIPHDAQRLVVRAEPLRAPQRRDLEFVWEVRCDD